jgi:uncharacterized protein (TIGR03435 family)
MNMEERQQPWHVPQGTSAPPFSERNEDSVARSQAEKLPAGTLSICTSGGGSDTFFMIPGALRHLIVLLPLASAIPCAGQVSAAARPAFTVATIKPTQHGRTDGLSISSDPEISSPGTFSVTNNSLDELIRWAYRVHEYQVSGPKWLNEDSECFDIAAKMPPGTTKGQARLMLQTLLEERFRLALHRETRTLPVYELLVANGGIKTEKAKADAKPGISYMGKFWSEVTAENTSAAEFATFLGGRLRQPVIDRTGIQARFSIKLEYRIDDNDSTRPGLFTAMQEKMGLRLKATKGPVEILVIDHIEKMPSEN